MNAPGLEKRVEPAYPYEARQAQRLGTVVLSLEIGADGIPKNVRVVQPLGLGLDEEAIRAVQAWRFKPATKDGAPVAVVASVDVNFRLL